MLDYKLISMKNMKITIFSFLLLSSCGRSENRPIYLFGNLKETVEVVDDDFRFDDFVGTYTEESCYTTFFGFSPRTIETIMRSSDIKKVSTITRETNQYLFFGRECIVITGD
jgi:hypothetical protein